MLQNGGRHIIMLNSHGTRHSLYEPPAVVIVRERAANERRP